MTPEKEIDLCEAVATIGTKIDNLTTNLRDHSEMDTKNFETINATINKFEAKLDDLMENKLQGIILDQAERKGAKESRAVFWSLVTSGGLLSLWELFKAFFVK
jgi:hypothetical protein